MRYRNPDPRHRRPSLWGVFRWAVLDRLTGRRKIAPPGPAAPFVDADLAVIHDETRDARLTWIGHASFLLQMCGINILLDPVFSERIGWLYPRHVAPGLTPSQLPPIDLLLISHSHYDHLDAASVAAIDKSATVIAPRGLARLFVRQGFSCVIELDWWDAVHVKSVEVTFVPARHWSKRTLFDTNRSLWGGYVIRGKSDQGGSTEETSIYFAGDTAWFDGFAEIGRRFRGLDAALLPIGGYEPGWFMKNNHLNPEQAGQAFLDCGARRLVPMHWGTLQLTDEPLLEPIDRLRTWWGRAGAAAADRILNQLAVGETLRISEGPD
ncbi:MAG: MBL fold metallo-hydrolase [Planctomycetota bacterium]|nr:MAG: MBL fold metallo-hydrolase [Planctomycetota bacterium]REJ93249.1 MAG: MBL fold metallo-hydrolase [Planctomycetota bacterium]REK22801.1 MAG: MBL fold metallo-hydrolase [Planctomycetota bacterium]REK33779.1 MAG: MBL fold metallo-hydrolase [Planctomycetota bacterium]